MKSKLADKIDFEEKVYENYGKRSMRYDIDDQRQISEIFKKELKRAKIIKGSKILEIGFGEGHFLDWAKGQNYQVLGIEINPVYVKMAEDRGHEVYFGALEKLNLEGDQSFDLVCCFDVFEHMTVDEIVSLFSELKSLLNNNGKIIIRVPNGVSPFGRMHQHSDLTHQTTLSGPAIADIAMIAGFGSVRIYNSARSLKFGRQRKMILKIIAYFIRDFIEIAIGLIYFGKILPMDPNITVVIKKK